MRSARFSANQTSKPMKPYMYGRSQLGWPEAHKQAEYQCYSEDGGDPLTELALDLYALVELPERGRRAPEVDTVEQLPLAADLSPPF
jgi:hypothetical protein